MGCVYLIGILLSLNKVALANAAVARLQKPQNAPRHIARAILWALAITVFVELVPVTALLLGATLGIMPVVASYSVVVLRRRGTWILRGPAD